MAGIHFTENQNCSFVSHPRLAAHLKHIYIWLKSVSSSPACLFWFAIYASPTFCSAKVKLSIFILILIYIHLCPHIWEVLRMYEIYTLISCCIWTPLSLDYLNPKIILLLKWNLQEFPSNSFFEQLFNSHSSQTGKAFRFSLKVYKILKSWDDIVIKQKIPTI